MKIASLIVFASIGFFALSAQAFANGVPYEGRIAFASDDSADSALISISGPAADAMFRRLKGVHTETTDLGDGRKALTRKGVNLMCWIIKQNSKQTPNCFIGFDILSKGVASHD